MKLFFIIRAIHAPGGIERATIVVANTLAEKGHEVGLVVLAREGEPYFEISPKIKVHYLVQSKERMPFPLRDVRRYRRLRMLYKREQPDVIIIVDSARSFLNLPAARGFCKVTWEHFNANVGWSLMHGVSRRLGALRSDWVVTLTHQDADTYRRKYGITTVSPIPNPVTLTNISYSTLSEKVVLAVGRMHEQKGFDLLLDAWRRVENRKRGWLLRIVGRKDKMESLLKEKIKAYQLEDSVEIIPPTRNIQEQYAQASIYAMSSRYEGLPLVLIEAMASGLPIISFDCETGPRDIVAENVTGILVPPLDVEKLAEELDKLMTDGEKRKLFSTNAIKRAELFAPNIIGDKWEALFEQLKRRDK